MSNVDLTCAVKLSALPIRKLPVRGEANANARTATRKECPDRMTQWRAPMLQKGYGKGRTPGNKGKRFQPTPITDDDFLVILAGCSKTSSTGRRNAALFAVMFRAGLRISEALDLRLEDLRPDEGLVVVQHGKGDKYRVAAMDAYGWGLVAPWLERRARLGIDTDGFVFCTIQHGHRGHRVGSPYVRTVLHRIAADCGTTKRWHPHGFRHGLAFGMSQENVPIPIISKALGHSNIATTHTYLNHVDKTLLVDTIASRPAPGAQTGSRG